MRRALLLLPLLILAVAHAAPGKARPELRAIAMDYAANADLARAVAALKKKSATPADLLASLREPGRPEGPIEGGTRTIEITDGHGTKTDLTIVAPPTEVVRKGNLGLVVLLHGLKGNGTQALPLANELVKRGVVVVAPSAKPLQVPPEDGIPAALTSKFPHWWEYESSRSFPLEALRKARSLFSIDPDRVVLCGVSMGGYGTWNVGLRHADRFAATAPICGGLSRISQVGMSDEKSDKLLGNARLFPMLVIHGDKDTVVPYAPDKAAADKVASLGGEIAFRTLEGVGHDVKDAILSGPLSEELKTFVTTKRRVAPRKIAFVTGDQGDGAHWLRVAKRAAGVDRVTLEGTIERNAIDVSATGAETLRVYLDDRLLDPAKTVTVSVRGEVRWKGKIAQDPRAILESWRSREDERLVYPAFVELDLR